MKLYQKIDDNGVSHIMPMNKIIVIKDSMQIFNPTDDILVSDGWEEYIVPKNEITNEQNLELEKESIIDDICIYDSSDNVNIFYVNNIPMWLDKSTRAGLMLRLQAEIAMGLEETTLWYDSLEFKMTPQIASQMLFALEVYASKCYDRTQYHIAAIKSLIDIKDVKNYDYTTGYPDKLYFNF